MFSHIRTFSLAVVSILFLSNCTKEGIKETVIDPSSLNLSITYDSKLDNAIYPSLIVGMANYSISSGNEFNFFTIELTNPKPTSSLKIVLEDSKFTNQTVLTEQLTEKNKLYSFTPTISWKYDVLKQSDQPGNVSLNFIVYIDNEEIQRKTVALAYRSINECVYFINDPETPLPLYPLFGAYVNEDHPMIDQVLSNVLAEGIVSNFKGYQGDEQEVLFEVFALWYHLQKKGVKYSSITNTSNSSKKVYTQYVRFFDQVYNNVQANCVDGTVFMASVLKKIGINPVLVLEPGHMYLGFFAKKNNQSLYVLETTLIGSVNLNQYSSLYDKIINSAANFDYATQVNIDRYNSNIQKMNNPNEYFYWSYDLENLRKVIQPINKRVIQSTRIAKRVSK